MADAGEPEKVVVVPAQISQRAATVVDRFKSEFGVTQKAAVEMGLEFLGSLPPSVLREVFRRGGDPIGHLVSLKRADEAGVSSEADSVEKSLAIIRRELAIVENLARGRKEQRDEARRAGKQSK